MNQRDIRKPPDDDHHLWNSSINWIKRLNLIVISLTMLKKMDRNDCGCTTISDIRIMIRPNRDLKQEVCCIMCPLHYVTAPFWLSLLIYDLSYDWLIIIIATHTWFFNEILLIASSWHRACCGYLAIRLPTDRRIKSAWLLLVFRDSFIRPNDWQSVSLILSWSRSEISPQIKQTDHKNNNNGILSLLWPKS